MIWALVSEMSGVWIFRRCLPSTPARVVVESTPPESSTTAGGGFEVRMRESQGNVMHHGQIAALAADRSVAAPGKPGCRARGAQGRSLSRARGPGSHPVGDGIHFDLPPYRATRFRLGNHPLCAGPA